MTTINMGILHPGEMGISVATSAKNSGHSLFWVSHGRSKATRSRAERFDLLELQSLQELCETCSMIISVCPPKYAGELSQQVLEADFKGIFVDANAISPMRSQEIGSQMAFAGVEYVDGGIIGGPAWKENSTFLYLSGLQSERVARCFEQGPLVTRIIGEEIGRASAIKMCYAAKTKGMTALLCSIVATANELGVWDELERHWSTEVSGTGKKALEEVQKVTTKAWRFSGEMEEIASTLEFTGLPSGFHKAAAATYQRMAHFKDYQKLPELEEVLRSLVRSS